MLIPYEKLKIKSPLSATDALKKLDEVIEPKRSFRKFWDSNHKPYEGKIDGSQFTTTRIIHYRNSFLPVIKGEVQSEISGSTINVTMYPHILVILFMSLWLGFVGFFFIVILSSFISSISQASTVSADTPTVIFIPAAMFIFGYTLLLGSFKFESVKSKAYFRELFQASEVEEAGIVNLFNRE